jgi:hypothetical protein
MTQAEQLNELAGCKIFAERLDTYGLPVDGWSLPVITQASTVEDKMSMCATYCMGTFRVIDGEIKKEAVFETTQLRELYNDRDWVVKLRERLMSRLFERLKSC